MRTKIMALAVIAMLVSTSLIGRVEAAAGDLDTTFDLDGIAVTDFGPNSAPTSIAIQADGKALVAGSSNLDFALVRYNTDGKLDQSFGVGGKVTTDFGGTEVCMGIAIRPDGRIVLAGRAYPSDGSGSNIALARYKVDGSLDTTFGSGGTVILDYFVPATIFDVELQTDVNIVVAGNMTIDASTPAIDIFVARFTSSGNPDASFGGGDGYEITDFFNPRDYGNDLVIQPDGKIVVAGATNDEFGISFEYLNFDYCMARYNTDGSLDASFGMGGRVVTESFGKGRTADVLLLSNGKLVLAGTSQTEQTSYADFALIRYNSNGSVDTSFGTNGYTKVNLGTISLYDEAEAAALQSDGKIVVAGLTDNRQNAGLARFNANGSLDTSFGTNGTVVTDVDQYDHCTDVAIYADGRIAISIWTQHSVLDQSGNNFTFSNFAAARYLGSGTPQPADLSINMTDSPDPVRLVQTLTYTITVTNNEFFYPKAAHVTLQNPLPAGTEFVALQVPAGWVVYEKPAVGGTGKISCSTYTLAAGQTAQFMLAVRVRNAASGSTISNTAQVKSATPDPVGSNNKKTVTTAVN